MFKNVNRVIIFTIVITLLVFVAVRCVPEKKVNRTTKITPVEWLNEDELLVRIGDRYFIRNPSGTLEPSVFGTASSSLNHSLPEDITPNSTVKIWSEEFEIGNKFTRTEQYIEIEGDKHQVRKSRPIGRNQGINQGFSWVGNLDFYTYLHRGKIGILTFDEATAQKIDLPIQGSGNLARPAVIRDSISNMFFAFQAECGRNDADGTCTRSAWWLNSDLKVISSFLLPSSDPLFTKEKFACFSCGCGCFTQEDVYAINGQAYFHFSGWPISTSKRGLYKVVGVESEATEWQQVIKGRIEPPLAFSPSGCQVAYFHVSRFGDSLQTKNLCH